MKSKMSILYMEYCNVYYKCFNRAHHHFFLCALVKSIYNHNNSAYLVLHPHKASSMTSSKF